VSEVVTFIHRGLHTAIPGRQATHLDRVPREEDRRLALWQGAHVDEPYWLCVEVSGGAAWLRCTKVRLAEIKRSSMLELSPVVREAMRELPHVVGSAWTAERHTWLVDLSRLALAHAAKFE
jgi:hypothetical protein